MAGILKAELDSCTYSKDEFLVKGGIFPTSVLPVSNNVLLEAMKSEVYILDFIQKHAPCKGKMGVGTATFIALNSIVICEYEIDVYSKLAYISSRTR